MHPNGEVGNVSVPKCTCVLAVHQVAEPQVTRLCVEAQECMVMERWFDLASLMLTSAEVIFSKVSEKGIFIIL